MRERCRKRYGEETFFPKGRSQPKEWEKGDKTMKTYLKTECYEGTPFVTKYFASERISSTDVEDILRSTKNLSEEDEFEELTEETWEPLKGNYSQSLGVYASPNNWDEVYQTFLRNSDPNFSEKEAMIDGELYFPIEAWKGYFEESESNPDVFWVGYIDNALTKASSFDEAVKTYITDRYSHNDQVYVNIDKVAEGCYHANVKYTLEDGYEEEEEIAIFHSCLRSIKTSEQPFYEMAYQEVG